MKDHLDRVIQLCADELNGWIGDGRKLCDLKTVYGDGCDYSLSHVQALYLLRFYPAYFVENYMMFNVIKNDIGAPAHERMPFVSSLACGSMVDAAAAKFVFEDNCLYDGYDVNRWLGVDENCIEDKYDFYQTSVFDIESLHVRANIVVFSRSLMDIGLRVSRLNNMVASTEFVSDVVYVCGTFPPGIRNDFAHNRLCEFAGFFEDFDREVLYRHTVDGEERLRNGGIVDVYDWFSCIQPVNHSALLARCTQDSSATCPSQECNNIQYLPIRNFSNLEFEVFKLTRR